MSETTNHEYNKYKNTAGCWAKSRVAVQNFRESAVLKWFVLAALILALPATASAKATTTPREKNVETKRFASENGNFVAEFSEQEPASLLFYYRYQNQDYEKWTYFFGVKEMPRRVLISDDGRNVVVQMVLRTPGTAELLFLNGQGKLLQAIHPDSAIGLHYGGVNGYSWFHDVFLRKGRPECVVTPVQGNSLGRDYPSSPTVLHVLSLKDGKSVPITEAERREIVRARVSRLLPLLKSKSPNERWKGLSRIAPYDNSMVVPYVLPLLDDPSFSTEGDARNAGHVVYYRHYSNQAAAAGVALTFLGVRLLPRLRQKLATANSLMQVHWLDVISRLRYPSVGRILRYYSEHGAPDVRERATLLLKYFKPQRV